MNEKSNVAGTSTAQPHGMPEPGAAGTRGSNAEGGNFPEMFQYTAAQKSALRLLSGPARHTMLFGGSRSGKTFVLCCAILARAGKAPGSRHAIILCSYFLACRIMREFDWNIEYVLASASRYS